MRTAQSDLILDFINDAAKVEVEIATHVDQVVLRLGEWVGPILGGEDEPDLSGFRFTLLALKAGLGDSREKLNAAEQHNIELVRRAVELRHERKTLNDGLYDDFTSMRRTIEELYRGKGKANPNAFVVAGIQGPTQQRPTRLLRQIDLAVTYLSQPGLEFPASRFGNTQLSPQDLVDALQPRADRLREVQAELQQLGSELNASRKEKKRALELHKKNFSWVATGASALFQLAGESELAERIRPSRRRRRRDTAADESVASGEAQEGAEPDETDDSPPAVETEPQAAESSDI